MYSNQKEYRKSIEYYETVLKNLGPNNDSIRGNILPKLGGEYLKFNDYDKASEYLIQGLILNRKSNNKRGLTISLNNLGELNLSQKKIKYGLHITHLIRLQGFRNYLEKVRLLGDLKKDDLFTWKR